MAGSIQMPHPRICRVCKKHKHLNSFIPVKSRMDGRGMICKNCQKIFLKKWVEDRKKTHTEQYNRQRRDIALKYKYGITSNEYDELFIKQNGKCAICGRENPGSNYRHFAVHHLHHIKPVKTECLLCFNCNVGMGAFKDKKDLLIKASQFAV